MIVVYTPRSRLVLGIEARISLPFVVYASLLNTCRNYEEADLGFIADVGVHIISRHVSKQYGQILGACCR